MGSATTGRIRELDGWRGVSILLVLVDHMAIFSFPGFFERFKWLYSFCGSAGALGVDIFFVISGFVITRLLVLEEEKHGSVSLKGFYARRFFRILPVFYLFLLVLYGVSRLGWTPVHRSNLMLAGLFLGNVRHLGWFLGHTWSLAVEEQFYLVFPLFWILSSRRIRPKFLAATLVAFLGWALLRNSGVLSGSLSTSAIVGFSCINVGALLAVFEPQARKAAAKVHPLVILLVAAFFFSRPIPRGPLTDSIYDFLLPFGIGLLLTYTISRPGWTSFALKTAVIQWVGLVSYSAYLWQEIFTGPAEVYGSPAIARGMHAAIPLLFAVAAASFYWIERPCTRLGRKVSNALQQRPVAAAQEVSPARMASAEAGN